MNGEVKLNISQSRGYESVNLELIKVTTNEVGQQLVSGRELYERLKVKQDFTDWMKKQLELVDATENEEFTLLKRKTQEKGGRPSIDYILTLEIAKEICMVVGVSPRTNEETRKLSKQVRKYFIECEKRVKQQAQTQIPNSPMDILKVMFSALEEQKQDIEEVKGEIKHLQDEQPLYSHERKKVSKKVKVLGTNLLGGKSSPAYNTPSLRSKVYSDIYQQLHREFGVDSCDEIKRRDYSVAFNIIQNYSLPIVLRHEIDYVNSQMSLDV